MEIYYYIYMRGYVPNEKNSITFVLGKYLDDSSETTAKKGHKLH
jgi:hypothetical protein